MREIRTSGSVGGPGRACPPGPIPIVRLGRGARHLSLPGPSGRGARHLSLPMVPGTCPCRWCQAPVPADGARHRAPGKAWGKGKVM